MFENVAKQVSVEPRSLFVNVENSFSRLTERVTWPGGRRLQTSGGERAGKSGWDLFPLLLFLCLCLFTYSGNHQISHFLSFIIQP